MPARGPNGPLKKRDIAVIQTILASVGGVFRLGVNVAQNVVYVDHGYRTSSAPAIRNALAQAGYPCSVQRDGGAGEACAIPGVGTVAPSKFVESTLMLPYLDDLDRVRRLERFMRKSYVKSQVRAFFPHVPSRTIKVEHDPRLVTAPQIVDAMRMMGAGPKGKGGGNWYDRVEVVCDGAVEGLALPLDTEYDAGEKDAMGNDEDGMNGSTCLGGLHINVMASGFFWVISMLSYVDGW